MRFLACFVRKGGERVIEVGGRFELRLDGILEARVASGDWCIRTVLPSCGNVVILLLVLLPDLAIVNASRSLHNLLLKIIVCMRFIEPLWSHGFHQHSPLTANCLVKNRQIGLDLPQLNRDIYGLVKKWKLSNEESKAVGGGWRRNEGVGGGLGGTEAEQSEQSEPQRFHGIGKASHDVLRVHRELGGLVKIDFPIFDDQQFTTSGSGCVIGGKDPQLMTDYDIVVANHDVIRTLHHIPFSDDDVIGLECQFDCGDIFHHFLDVVVDGVAVEVEPSERQHVEGAT